MKFFIQHVTKLLSAIHIWNNICEITCEISIGFVVLKKKTIYKFQSTFLLFDVTPGNFIAHSP